MAKRNACFGALKLRNWTVICFGRWLFLLVLGNLFVGEEFVLNISFAKTVKNYCVSHIVVLAQLWFCNTNAFAVLVL